MNKIYCAALIIVAGSFLSAAPISNSASTNPLPKGYYVVVAAYFSHQEDFAQRYSSKLNEGGLHTRYGLDQEHKFIYVYLDRYSDFNESVSQMLKARKEGTCGEAWVSTVKEGPDPIEPMVAKKEEPLQQKQLPKKIEPQPQKITEPVVVKNDEPKVVVGENKVEKPQVITEVVDNPLAKPVFLPQTLNNTPVFLSLYNSTNNEVVDGDVEVVDTEHSRLMTKVKGNTYITLPNPGTKTGQLTLVSNTFGYRKEQLEINYKNTEGDTTKPYVVLVGNFYMLNFGLSRFRKGDISTLYNVYFFNDAAIMMPDSKYQLNSLLQLMNDNPKLKIVLHGHTNGGGGGKIIFMGKSKDFFAINKEVEQGSGSARELSEARAKVIREWLLTQGITQDRVTVRGWGGSRMIHDKNSVHARKNIRVDVEVVEE